MTARAAGGGLVRLGAAELVAGRGDHGASGEIRLTIRPERVRLEPPASSGENRLPGIVERVVYLGPTTQFVVRLNGGPTLQAMTASGEAQTPYAEGSEVTVVLPRDALRVLSA
jgi:spermidine/putrescine transport system ATP-binding protein